MSLVIILRYSSRLDGVKHSALLITHTLNVDNGSEALILELLSCDVLLALWAF